MVGNYRAAVVLNNTGVALLERGAYRQAMATFKDAILVMKRSLRCTAGLMKPALSDVEVKIENAAKRLANPQPFPLVLPTSVVSHDGSLQYSAMKSALTHNAFCAVPIRIEPSCLQEDTDLDSTILLYNFAIAHICMAKLTECTADIEQFREGSLKLLQMACSIASEEDMLDMDDECGSTFSEVRLLLSAAALKNIGLVLWDMGRLPEAYATQQQYLELGASLEEMEELSFLIGDTHSAAA